MAKRTPLYEQHLELRGRMVDFSGWSLPVEFSGIIAEHAQVRNSAGLFDVSHMGEILVTGLHAQSLLQLLVTSDVSRLAPGQISYTLMCYEDGGVVDDLLVYKYAETKFLLVVNASNVEKDYAWIVDHQLPETTVQNISDLYAQIAVQGPLAEAILQSLCPDDLAALQFYWFLPLTSIANRPALVSRTGYTGEHGFEIYLAPDDAPFVWQEILRVGGSRISPIGLGARDTLRFEAKLPLYGHEINRDITPLEAGLDWFVKFNKSNFIGREVLLTQKQSGVPRKLVELQMLERGIPRAGYPVQIGNQAIGHITSGSFAPTLAKNVGLALIDGQYAALGQEVVVMVRNKPVLASIAQGIFYTPAYRRK